MKPRTELLPTPSQTVGPFFGMALPWPDCPFVVGDGIDDCIWIRGRVTDGRGDPIPDALIETWASRSLLVTFLIGTTQRSEAWTVSD